MLLDAVVRMPVLAKVMGRLASEVSDICFYIPIAHPDYQKRIKSLTSTGKYKVLFTGNEDYNIFAASDLALSKTGTSVQILMALGVPTIAFYTVVSSLWYNFTKRYILDFEHIAFPNIIAGHEIIPEFVQDDFTVSNLLIAAMNLLNDDAKRSLMNAELLEIRNKLYRPDALERAASIALELCERKGWRKS